MRLDEAPLRAALSALLDVQGAPDARRRLTEIARASGIEAERVDSIAAQLDAEDPRDGWTVGRIPGGFVLRWNGDEDPFELQIRGDTVRIVPRGLRGVASAPSEAEGTDLMEEALDASAGTVLRWLRSSGHRPAQASRLAALYAPRLRGSSWPSSLP